MAKLIVSLDNQVIKEVPLGKVRTMIGRKPHNDIQIDNLAISGEHAMVVVVENDAFLEDMGSTNGTFVNGQAVKKHMLQNGDTIELGKYRLKYVNDAPAPAAGGGDFEKTMIIRPGALAQAAAGAPPAAAAPAVATPPPQAAAPVAAAPTLPLGVIQVLNGANAGKQLELVKTLTTLGKPGVQVAVIARRPHGYFITHVEGANFPVLNGVTLDTKPHLLSDHDIVELAGVKMEFFLKG
jgi:predicted component of type VI protein secretion system